MQGSDWPGLGHVSTPGSGMGLAPPNHRMPGTVEDVIGAGHGRSGEGRIQGDAQVSCEPPLGDTEAFN